MIALAACGGLTEWLGLIGNQVGVTARGFESHVLPPKGDELGSSLFALQ